MNIFVFVKRVPDTESKIKINHETNSVIEEGLNFVVSPYDEYAVEEALRIKEAKGGQVTVFSVGSDETTPLINAELMKSNMSDTDFEWILKLMVFAEEPDEFGEVPVQVDIGGEISVEDEEEAPVPGEEEV